MCRKLVEERMNMYKKPIIFVICLLVLTSCINVREVNPQGVPINSEEVDSLYKLSGPPSCYLRFNNDEVRFRKYYLTWTGPKNVNNVDYELIGEDLYEFFIMKQDEIVIMTEEELANIVLSFSTKPLNYEVLTFDMTERFSEFSSDDYKYLSDERVKFVCIKVEAVYNEGRAHHVLGVNIVD